MILKYGAITTALLHCLVPMSQRNNRKLTARKKGHTFFYSKTNLIFWSPNFQATKRIQCGCVFSRLFNWQIFLIMYTMIVDHDIYWLTETAFRKTILAAQIWTKWTKIESETRHFCHFLKFGLLPFPEIAYNDSLQ